MPDYPEVSIEEAPHGPKPIEGVDTDLAAFLGQTGFGPAEPTAVYSVSEYLRLFGVGGPGYLADAIAGFFGNGGRRAVVARVGGALADYDAALTVLEGEAGAGVSLVYSPDATATPGLPERLITHCERLADRFAVIDAPRGDPLPPRAAWDTRYAAYYCPWLAVPDAGGAPRLIPPGGHVLGVYARVDIERGVFKAPANEVVQGAVGLERDITEREQEDLNPAGVNVIRSFPGRGIRVWGARTLSSDPEWKYVNVRRLLIFLERSIDRGTQWTVFEPNGERLWSNVRDTIRNFLRGQWRAGAFQGQTEDKAFFVRCDRTTMTQADLDAGRLVCVVGVAPLRPAEFVIFRIGQRTADHRDPP